MAVRAGRECTSGQHPPMAGHPGLQPVDPVAPYARSTKQQKTLKKYKSLEKNQEEVHPCEHNQSKHSECGCISLQALGSRVPGPHTGCALLSTWEAPSSSGAVLELMDRQTHTTFPLAWLGRWLLQSTSRPWPLDWSSHCALSPEKLWAPLCSRTLSTPKGQTQPLQGSSMT